MSPPTAASRFNLGMPWGTAGASTQQMLQTLQGPHARLFPIPQSGSSKPVPEADTPQGRAALAEKAYFMRMAIGGWLEAVTGQEGKNGGHDVQSTATLLDLDGAITGPVDYIITNPSVLFARPSSTCPTVAATPIPPSTLENKESSAVDVDLVSFLFPRILQATACLETALLLSPRPPLSSSTAPQEGEAEALWRVRQATKLKLENLLETMISVLSSLAVRLDWRSKDSIVRGGLGKARQMMEDMFRLMRGLVSSPPTSYPFDLRTTSTSISHSKALSADPFDSQFPTPSLVVLLRSSTHARGLLLSISRVLVQTIQESPFLVDFIPNVADLFLDSWPDTGSYLKSASSSERNREEGKLSLKGKERARETGGGKELASINILAETMEIISSLTRDGRTSLAASVLTLSALRVRELFAQRLNNLPNEGSRSRRNQPGYNGSGAGWIEDGEATAVERVDFVLASLLERMVANVREPETSDRGQGISRQLIAGLVAENGETLVRCVIDRDVDLGLKLASLFVLSLPLIPRLPLAPAVPPFASASPTLIELLSPTNIHHLTTFVSQHTSVLPFNLTPYPSLSHISNSTRRAWADVWEDLHNRLPDATGPGGGGGSGKKRKRTDDLFDFGRGNRSDQLSDSFETDVDMGGRNDGLDSGTGLGVGTTGGRRKKAPLMLAVRSVLRLFVGEEAWIESEGVESTITRLMSTLSTASAEVIIGTLNAVGLLGCARDGTLTFPSSSSSENDQLSRPSCSVCDALTDPMADVVKSDQDNPRAGAAARVFTSRPLKCFLEISGKIFDGAQEGTPDGKQAKVRLGFLRSLARLIRHSNTSAVVELKLESGGVPLLRTIFGLMEAETRSIRMAAGNVVHAVVQGYQENDMTATSFVAPLSRLLDIPLKHSHLPVQETALIALGRFARVAIPQGLLECECLVRLVTRLNHPNAFLKSSVRTQLSKVAIYRDIKAYTLIQPHFARIWPALISEGQSTESLHAALDFFHLPKDSLIRITREYTLPTIILNDQQRLLVHVAESSELPIATMLIDPEIAAAILAFLYMKPEAEKVKGIKVFLREITGVTTEVEKFSLASFLLSVKVPLVYRLALEMGDEDPTVAAKAETALISMESAMQSTSSGAGIDLGAVLKSSIVGILSHMNRGLNEPATHRPLRDKQRIIRSLASVTSRVGPAIAGFSPQIMATLQSALEVSGLRAVTLYAFKCFLESLKFSDIGPFIGTTSATFVRLWSEFTPVEKVTATQVLEYIVLNNAEDLKRFVPDVADLSGIPELEQVNQRLQTIRIPWSFDKRSKSLLSRIDSESDVVVSQALKELKTLMSESSAQLQGFAAGDSFDRSVGELVKSLFSAAIKDGPENEQIRSLAFECIGILGALDPDRFEVPPADPPTIVLENFTNQEESIKFALHLIQGLLIGAYRSTNDTKHQEFLAFAIQELLGFCGFTVDLVLPSGTGGGALDPDTRRRWDALPKNVLETCGPLLGGSFTFLERTAPNLAVYPIYTSTHSYRDWIRIWANGLIAKLEGTSVKRIFGAFPPVLHLEDIAIAQHLLPHLVLNALISGTDEDRDHVKREIETVLQDQVTPSQQLSENSRLLSAQTVFDLMDHLSRWITLARIKQSENRARTKKSNKAKSTQDDTAHFEITQVEGILQDIPHVLVGQAALMCKAYARSLLNFESHIVAQRSSKKDVSLQVYYENLHECYADLDEPDGMEGISTKIVAPSVLHQIREHESTGRWTSAQSCWEVKLQQQPDDATNHIGLLRCLRNLGHYDSMRTHIVGILHSRHHEAGWDRILAPFNIEASLIVGKWDAVEEALQIPDIEGPEIAFGKVISAMKQGSEEQLARAFFEARDQLGGPIVAAGRESYRRVYDSVIHLHILHELEAIQQARKEHPSAISNSLSKSLAARLDSTSPSFRAREPILNMRRTALKLTQTPASLAQIGSLWLETAKIARKAGHQQTAYSAILQARDLDAPFTFLQNAKLLMAADEEYKAIQNIDNALQPMIPAGFGRGEDASMVTRGPPTLLAKASLRRARWMHQAGRLEPEEIVERYQEAAKLSPDWESPYYYLGQYWNLFYEELSRKTNHRPSYDGLAARMQTCQLFSQALLHGTKYIYQAMPRMLTIWLEIGESTDLLRIMRARKADPTADLGASDMDLLGTFSRINRIMNKNKSKLPTYQWLTVLPQLVSRILHENTNLYDTLEGILLKVLANYPQQAFWAMASGTKSEKSASSSKRMKRTLAAFDKAKKDGGSEMVTLITDGIHLVDHLLALCNHNITKNDPLSMRKTFPALYKLAPSSVIIPLQSSLNVSLPSDASQTATHKPFGGRLVVFQKFEDTITIMSSLQKPRKISVFGDDGAKYTFLCKPKDDLRKDTRLMEFNSMIIKLLKKDSESRKRRLTIRTYSVVPLNEECGLIEWVPNVVVLRTILNKSYASKGISPWSPELKETFEHIRDDPNKTGERFEKEVLSKFPPVFHEWFLETFPEPSAWLRARLAYSRTNAVMCMVGFILGLGDRHCENILLDGTTGDTVHVDFNCLFDKGRTFDVAEQVPFRLSTNIVDGFGVTGVEGVYRHAAEITLRILRDNKDSLSSVLETFFHDPLLEWDVSKKKSKHSNSATAAQLVAREARKNLDPVLWKLRGLQVVSDPASRGDQDVSVGEQVERLIREARNPRNLGSMYVGWCAWF